MGTRELPSMMEKNPIRNQECQVATLRSQSRVGFELPNSSDGFSPDKAVPASPVGVPPILVEYDPSSFGKRCQGSNKIERTSGIIRPVQ